MSASDEVDLVLPTEPVPMTVIDVATLKILVHAAKQHARDIKRDLGLSPSEATYRDNEREIGRLLAVIAVTEEILR